jgi:hypothetical protein
MSRAVSWFTCRDLSHACEILAPAKKGGKLGDSATAFVLFVSETKTRAYPHATAFSSLALRAHVNWADRCVACFELPARPAQDVSLRG